jgi:hypothetical protein
MWESNVKTTCYCVYENQYVWKPIKYEKKSW